MSGFALYDVQQALYECLSGDASLMALIEGVYDRVPHSQNMPYVVIGDASASDASTQSTQGMLSRHQLHVYSRKAGRKQALNIMARLYALLHERQMSVPNHSLILMRLVSCDIVLEGDGQTYHGRVMMEIHTEQEEA